MERQLAHQHCQLFNGKLQNVSAQIRPHLVTTIYNTFRKSGTTKLIATAFS